MTSPVTSIASVKTSSSTLVAYFKHGKVPVAARSTAGPRTEAQTRTGVHCPTDDAVRQTFMDAEMTIPSPDASAPGCCAPPLDPRIARHFDEKAGAWTDGEAFPEMVDVSAALLDLLRDTPLRRPSVLELGCGTGGLSVALLEMGAARVTGIDLSTTSIEVASRRARASGFAAQASFRHGNAATADVEPHDLVILDRVICCFNDVERLVDRAMAA